MKDPLTRLTERTATLGNYNRKYLHIISNNIENLTSTLEQCGKQDRVHLWSHSMEVPGEMDTILGISSDQKEKLDFLGCYYALQFLQMNLRMVDIVKLELATGPVRWPTARKLMLESGRSFRSLTKSYMERLLNIFLEDEDVPEYVMLGVGTRADQDDIDLGIIHRSPGNAESLNRAISRLNSQMFKKATRLHFHLSEYVGDNLLTATIEEYEAMLEKGAYNFVIVTEMLGAATIIGSYSLFNEFVARVTNRFFYDVWNKENYYHEGYLRGILSEVRSLLNRMKAPYTINPKDDILRPIKSMLAALKLVYGVHRTDTFHMIDELKEKNALRVAQYSDLEQALSFFELFRHLYQIMVAQDEDIGLSEPGIEASVAEIAGMMGFEDKGVVSAKDFMLVNYYEFLDKSIQAIDILASDLKNHLREISVLKPIFSGEIHTKTGYRGNLAIDFIRAMSSARGFTYWDDFLEVLGAKDGSFYGEFIDSFDGLKDRVKAKLAQGYVAGTRFDPGSVLRFLVILGEKASDDKAKVVFNLISEAFLEELGQMPGGNVAMDQMLHSYPGDLNEFLALIEWDTLSRFRSLVKDEATASGSYPVHRQLRALTDVHHQSSHFFKRHFHQIIAKYPTFIRNLHHNEKLLEITKGFYSDLTAIPSLNERVERLGDYYDLEFVRVSLLAMSGAECERTDAEFIEFCDNYTALLCEYSQQQVHLSLGFSLGTRDRFSLYATGGHAREQGFDDDYDMIVLLDSTDPEEVDYCNKIVGKMNSQILKRGILPHHRFADQFGSYVIGYDQLAEFIGSEGEEIFVDKSQILSSRMLVGSSRSEDKLCKEIIEPLIFARGREYIEFMMAEMKSRHDDPEQRSNIKECPGGLRDIEMLLLMYEVKHKVREPLSRRFLQHLVEIEPGFAEEFAYIETHLNFVKNLRDLYRLKVAAHNTIDEECLPPIAASMGYGNNDGAGEKLYEEFLKKTEAASKVIDKLVDAVL